MRCAYCNQGIRKYSITVHVEDAPTKYHHEHSGHRYHYLHGAPRPKNMADCQRLTNRKVISISRHEQVLKSWNEWDGESYLPSYKFFCSNDCAGCYARATINRAQEKA